MSGARAVTSLELRRHLRNTLSQSPRGSQPANGNLSSTTSTTVTSPLKIPKRITKVRRDLFGPIDREECNRFIEMEMNRKQTIDSERWGFDFTNGVPLYNNENFEWEPVYNFLPNYYSQSHHQRQPESISIAAPPTTANTSSSHYFQDPNDQSTVDFDVNLLNGVDNEGDCSGDSSDDNKMIIDSVARQSNDFDLDTVLSIGSISERTPLQNHNSNQQPYRKFRQLSITDLMRNRKRFATTLNVSPVKKTTASVTSTTATATITSSPLQSSLNTTKPLTIRSTASTTITSSSRRSIEAKRTAKKLKFSTEPQTK